MAKQPDSTDKLLRKGSDLISKGKYEEAVEICTRVLEQTPRSTDAYLCKCNGLKGLGREKEALECYDKALEIDPNSVRAWVNKGNILFTLDRKDEAMEALHEAKRVFPEDRRKQQVMVTKRNGRTEPFDREKIIRAIKYTGASEEEAQEVAIEVERTSRPTMTTSEIDRMVLDRLKPRNLSSYYRWLQWKEGHKQT